jgi:RimJ/RimL family protein N-acetyltransferase
MTPHPTLKTKRLLLRPFQADDAATVQRLAGDRRVASGTFLPHPYEDGIAEEWIARHVPDYEAGKSVHFAVVSAADNVLMGSIGLEVAGAHRHARLGYRLGVPYWNHGYCTEAVRAVLHYGFTELGLNRIYAPHFLGNAASGRVLHKVGMTYEGRLREHYRRFGQFVDVEMYGMLRREFSVPE